METIAQLNQARRPVLLAGNGIRLSEGREEFEKLVEILQIPVLTTWNGIDLIEEEHPLLFRETWWNGAAVCKFCTAEFRFLFIHWCADEFIADRLQF